MHKTTKQDTFQIRSGVAVLGTYFNFGLAGLRDGLEVQLWLRKALDGVLGDLSPSNCAWDCGLKGGLSVQLELFRCVRLTGKAVKDDSDKEACCCVP